MPMLVIFRVLYTDQLFSRLVIPVIILTLTLMIQVELLLTKRQTPECCRVLADTVFRYRILTFLKDYFLLRSQGLTLNILGSNHEL